MGRKKGAEEAALLGNLEETLARLESEIILDEKGLRDIGKHMAQIDKERDYLASLNASSQMFIDSMASEEQLGAVLKKYGEAEKDLQRAYHLTRQKHQEGMQNDRRVRLPPRVQARLHPEVGDRGRPQAREPRVQAGAGGVHRQVLHPAARPDEEQGQVSGAFSSRISARGGMLPFFRSGLRATLRARPSFSARRGAPFAFRCDGTFLAASTLRSPCVAAGAAAREAWESSCCE